MPRRFAVTRTRLLFAFSAIASRYHGNFAFSVTFCLRVTELLTVALSVFSAPMVCFWRPGKVISRFVSSDCLSRLWQLKFIRTRHTADRKALIKATSFKVPLVTVPQFGKDGRARVILYIMVTCLHSARGRHDLEKLTKYGDFASSQASP